MRKNANRLFVFLLGMAWLWGCCGVANAVTPMVSAQAHVLALKSDGTVYAWGRNSWGELGDNTTADRASPGQVAGLSNVKFVLAAGESSFVVKQDGTVFGWGISAPANSRTPVQLNGISNIVAVAWGKDFFSLKADGTVQEGLDAVPVQGLANITAISGGGSWAQSLALKSDGTVWAWGRNLDGELGDGTTTNHTSPTQISGLSGVVAISAGNGYSLALKSDGTVWAWGNNSTAQLGDGTTTNRLAPVLVQGLSNATSIAAGMFSSAAIKADGTVWDWGQSSIRGSRALPGPVSNILNAKAVAAAANGFTIVLKSDGTLSTWGDDNRYGTFGNGNFGGSGGNTNQVVSLNLSGSVTQYALPSGVFTMVPASGGGTYTVRCDASNSSSPDGAIVGYAWTTSNGQTATGQTPTFSFSQAGSYSIGLTVTDNHGGTALSTATVLLPQASVTPAIVKGSGQVLAIKSDGTLLSWGSNEFGQLGTGKTSSSTIPVLVASLNGVKAIAGSTHSLALRQDGTVWAWGDNLFAELGNGSSSGRSLAPIKVSNLADAKAIAAGWNQSLAVKSDGTVWQWGVGEGDMVSVPSQVQGLSNVTTVAAGLFHKLALKGDGTVWVWGDNQYGQYGNGTVFVWGQYGNGHTTSSPVPVQVPGLQNMTAIAAGSTYSLALQSDGSVWIWGDNRNGLLGTDASSPVTPPVKVQGVDQVVAIAGGSLLSSVRPLVLKADGTVYRVGYNSRSQIPGLQNIIAIADGVALKSDGTVFTWDDNPFNNSDGSFGDGTFASREGAELVVSQDGSGFLDLIPDVPNIIPQNKIPPFFTVASGQITASSATVSTTTKFNAADAGKSGAVFVTAMVPQSALGVPQAMRGQSAPNVAVAQPRSMALAAPASTFVLVQLTSSGWQPVVNGQLIPYASGVLGDQLAAQTILNNTDTTNLKGTEICLGYGTSAAEMNAVGRMRAIVTIPDPNATNASTQSCVLISDVRVFAYAEANYPSIFAGAATPGQYLQYNYRYYPGSQNYLAVDDSRVIFLLGPYTGGVVTAVGPVESFRSVITTWEAAP